MSSRKNLPNIPIYIGDWERDCNVLSLQSEGAWMRIVFKLWTKGKQNSIKIPAKSLQNLWRCSAQEMRDILDELIFNEICEICEHEGFIEFTCRRFVKENNLSEIRSKASKGESKSKQKTNKPSSKRVQITENDYDYESDNEIENKGKRSAEGKGTLALTLDISNFFKVSELRNPTMYFKISKLVRSTEMDYLKAQFEGYKSYKKITGEIAHSLGGYLGREEDFSDGAWCQCDWEAKAKSVQGSKQDLNTDDILAQVKRNLNG